MKTVAILYRRDCVHIGYKATTLSAIAMRTKYLSSILMDMRARSVTNALFM